ncbi:MAD2L1-binding protein-like [Amphiura filiformis]|uniref:MAD2L1-binding protein-like n=1 Tax=Amphiura filiformis TaxID=82378 RepID=UPI003B20ED5B
MAAVRKFPKKTAENYYCKIPLHGVVAPHSKARLVVETLKYLMFQRQQIPLPFEQLKFQQRQECEGRNTDKPTKKPLSLEQKRWATLVQSTEELIENIGSLFCVCKVSHILVIFGATIVSPKEVHHIIFTDQTHGNVTDDAKLSTKHCQRQFMRAMITNNNLIDAKTLPLTSTHMMVFAHRDSGLQWFKPKANFRMPARGQHYTFEVQCGSVQAKEGNGRLESSDDIPELSSETSSDSAEDKAGAACSSLSVSDSDVPDTHMWFQAPLIIKGVKDKTSRKASSSDIWM